MHGTYKNHAASGITNRKLCSRFSFKEEQSRIVLRGICRLFFRRVNIIENNIPGAHVVRADATYLIWVDVSAYTSDSAALKEEIFEKTGLYLSSGAAYGECGKRFLRINLATQRANVIDGMNRLKKALVG